MKILSVVALLALAVPLMAETAAEIYQKALAKEKGEGDFEAAIKLYEKVVQEAEGDSLLTARARLRLGLCQEKAGLVRAREVYAEEGEDGELPVEVRTEASRRLVESQSREAQLVGEEEGESDSFLQAIMAIRQEEFNNSHGIAPVSPVPTAEMQRLQAELKRLQETLPQNVGPEIKVHIEALRRVAEEQRHIHKQVIEQQQKIQRQVAAVQQQVHGGTADLIMQPAVFHQQLAYLKNGWVDDFRLSIEQAKIDEMLAQAVAAMGEVAKKEKQEYEMAQRMFDLGLMPESQYREAEAAYKEALGDPSVPSGPVKKALTVQRQFIERLAARTDHANLESLVENIERQRESVEGLASAIKNSGNQRLSQMLQGHQHLLDELQQIVEQAAERPSFTVPYPHTFLDKLPSVWKFSRSYPGMAGQAVDPEADDSGWIDIDIHHASGTRWGGGGTVWYRTTVDHLGADKDKPVHLAFAGVNAEVYVFVNGRLVGEQHRWGQPFVLDITPAVDFGGENTVALCLVSEGGQNTLRGEMFLLQPDTAGADYLLANRGGGLDGISQGVHWRDSGWRRHFSGDAGDGRKTHQRFKNYAEAPVSLPFAYRSVGEVPRRWRFRADDEGIITPELQADIVSPDFNHDGWAEINVGQAWEDQGYDGYDKGAWYRTRLKVKAQKGEPVFLAFGGVDRDALVYVNGKLVGNHHAWNRPFYLDISGAVNYDGENTVAVRVWDGQGMGGMYGKVEAVQPDKEGRLSRGR